MNSSVLIITHTPHCTKAVAHTQAAQRPISRPPRHTPLPTHTHIHKHILGKAQIVPGFFGVPLLLFFSVCFYFLCFPSFFFQVVNGVGGAAAAGDASCAAVQRGCQKTFIKNFARKYTLTQPRKHIHMHTHTHTHTHTKGAHKSLSRAAKMPKSFAQAKTKTKRENDKRSKNPEQQEKSMKIKIKAKPWGDGELGSWSVFGL